MSPAARPRVSTAPMGAGVAAASRAVSNTPASSPPGSRGVELAAGAPPAPRRSGRALVRSGHLAEPDEAPSRRAQRRDRAVEARELAPGGDAQIDLKPRDFGEPVALVEEVDAVQLEVDEGR